MGIVAKYKFDGSVYADLIPEFNAEFTDYTITDEVDSENSNYIIRTIESDSLPTLMRFGQPWEEGETRASDKSLALLEILDMDTSELKTGDAMFRYCVNLTSIVCNWNTSNITQTTDMFSICQSLVNIDVSNWEASKFTNIYKIFQDCNALRTLDMRNWNTSNITNFSRAFYSSDNITTLDISNWIISDNADISAIIGENTSLKYIKCNIPNTIQKISSLLPTRTADDLGVIIYQGTETLPQETIDILNSKGWTVNTNPTLIAKYKYDSTIYKNLIPEFNEGYMGFVEDEEVDANGIVTRVIEHVELPTYVRFGYNDYNKNTYSYAYKDIQYVNCTKISSIAYMFRGCTSLINLDVSDWNLNKITSYNTSFADCINMTSIIGLDMIDVSESASFAYMFSACKTLQKLDISNFKFKSDANLERMFASTNLLTDIGMIYCDQSTINKVASLLPTDHNITIWVESDDILQYDQYDHITYKTQKVQDTVHLNSPLLMGDTIEVIDGKTYHVHRWEKVVLDGSENYGQILNTTYTNFTRYYLLSIHPLGLKTSLPFSNNFVRSSSTGDQGREAVGIDGNGKILFSIRTSKLSSQSVNGFKQWLSENPTTVIYKLATPYYELISEEPLELTLLDTTDNTINNNSILPSNMAIANKELSTIAIKPSTTYTLSFDKSNVDSEVTIDICSGEQITTVLNRIELTTPSELGSGIRFISSDGCIISNVRLLEGSLVEKAIPKETFEGLQSSFDEGYIIGENLVGEVYHKGSGLDNSRVCKVPISKTLEVNTKYTFVVDVEFEKLTSPLHLVLGDEVSAKYVYQDILNSGINICHTTVAQSNVTHIYLYTNQNSDSSYIIRNLILLEGDHTHLSETELMRYIEKGTSHYEEEDFNHVGKYKVEYKVTGKNKFDKVRYVEFNKDLGWKCDIVTYNNKECVSIQQQNYQEVDILNSLNLDRKKTYTLSFKWFFEKSDERATISLVTNYTDGTGKIITISNTEGSRIFTTEEDLEIEKMHIGAWGYRGTIYLYDFQIEEGAVATEYEPYKEDIKTYYLSSPFLEGDTIEDVNGVATHVKRYDKVVLDGSENWDIVPLDDGLIYFQATPSLYHKKGTKCICDKYPIISSVTSNRNGITMNLQGIHQVRIINKNCTTVEELKNWLSIENLTVVYERNSYSYQPISEDSILLDSYTNGHLDVDTNIPIGRTVFTYWYNKVAYLYDNTSYTLQFNSDNNGHIDWLGVGGSILYDLEVMKGLNRFTVITPTDNNGIIGIVGIGFNASNIQVVEANEDIEFDYFKGLKSSFEDGLVTDENDENYGKYKVECKIVGKNLFDGELMKGFLNEAGDEVKTDSGLYWRSNFIKVNGSNITFSHNCKSPGFSSIRVFLYDSNFNIIKVTPVTYSYTFTLPISTNVKYVRFYYEMKSALTSTSEILISVQLEEGTQATPYEPYKESIHTLYLNSPLLKGDKLVVHDGKLCHYHKMGMVMLDGSEGLNYHSSGTPFVSYKTTLHGVHLTSNIISNTLTHKYIIANNTEKGVHIANSDDYKHIRIRLTDNDTVESVKQWLQQNPTTVVYELKEPYYEPIEPQLSSNSFSTVKDGDMEIITVLPIEKINLTYRTDINGVSSIEEQIASIQEGTDISSIIDEEVDE